MADTREVVTDIIRDVGGFEDGAEFDLDAPLEQLGIDSLDLAQIVIEIENQFCIDIGDEAFESFRTYGQVVTYVQGRVGL